MFGLVLNWTYIFISIIVLDEVATFKLKIQNIIDSQPKSSNVAQALNLLNLQVILFCKSQEFIDVPFFSISPEL